MLIEVYGDTRRAGVCRSCRAPVEWATVVKSGKPILFDPPVEVVRIQPPLFGDERAVEVIDTTRTRVHFASCPDAVDWRKPKAAR